MYNESQDGILLYTSRELIFNEKKKKTSIHLGVIILLGS